MRLHHPPRPDKVVLLVAVRRVEGRPRLDLSPRVGSERSDEELSEESRKQRYAALPRQRAHAGPCWPRGDRRRRAPGLRCYLCSRLLTEGLFLADPTSAPGPLRIPDQKRRHHRRHQNHHHDLKRTIDFRTDHTQVRDHLHNHAEQRRDKYIERSRLPEQKQKAAIAFPYTLSGSRHITIAVSGRGERTRAGNLPRFCRHTVRSSRPRLIIDGGSVTDPRVQAHAVVVRDIASLPADWRTSPSSESGLPTPVELKAPAVPWESF